MTTRVATALLALLVGSAAAVAAQQRDLEQVVGRLAAYWARGDAAGLATLAARSGLAIDLGGDAMGPLGPRQAAAVLRRVFDDRETVWGQPRSSKLVDDAPPRAFGEFTWTARVRGTTISERMIVFVALVREDAGWRITQIRLNP